MDNTKAEYKMLLDVVVDSTEFKDINEIKNFVRESLKQYAVIHKVSIKSMEGI